MKKFLIYLIFAFGVSISASENAFAVVYDGSKAAVMLTFEHSEDNQLTAIENSMGDMIGTISVISDRVGLSGYITQQELLDLQERGFEISGHSKTHERLSSSTSDSVLYEELVQSKIDLENMGFQIIGYVWPFNIVTNDAFEVVQENYLWTTFYSPIPYSPDYMDMETLNTSFETYGIYHTHSHGIGTGYALNTFSEVKDEIDFAIANDMLIGFKFHEISNGGGQFVTSISLYEDVVEYIQEQKDLGNIDVLTRSQGIGMDNADSTPPTTTASPPGGEYLIPQLVSLTADETATIYYALDGSTPTTSSTEYTEPILISEDTTLKFFGVDESENQEEVKTEEYTILNPGSNVIPFEGGGNVLCSATPCSLPIEVSPGEDRMIIIVSTVEGPISLIDSIDNTGGTGQGILVGREQVGIDGALQMVEMWRIMESDIIDGTNTVSINFDAIPSDAGVSLMSFSGVAQQPEAGFASSTVVSNPTISTEITTLVDDSLIISAVGNGQTGGIFSTHGDGQIERHSFSIPSAWHLVTTEVKQAAGVDVQSHTYSINSNRQAQVVAFFMPAFPDLDNDLIPDDEDLENIIDSSTTISESHTVANVTVQDGAVLTIPDGLSLTINSGSNITIEGGSGVMIKSGGALWVNS